MSITIGVTEGDIAQGATSCVTCPVALALRRVLAPGYIAAVGDSNVALLKNEDGFRAIVVPLALEARDFIARFDAGESVGPIAFPIDVPEYMRSSAEGH